ncbi:MAG: ABC transporter ATP-binding protein [Chloroflexota bacterium]
MNVIKTRDLTKKFKGLVAVDRVSLEIEQGECFGLLGPNGAGKTSLIRMVTGVSPISEGDVSVLGLDLKTHAREIKARIGVVPQTDNLDPDLTVYQNLTTFARYFDIPAPEAGRRSNDVLGLFELLGKRDSRIRELSGGMKRRLLLARGLINEPRILFLDEPTIGLDPQTRYLVWYKLIELRSQGITLLLCTQNMEEAAFLCNRVAIMHVGKVVTVGIPAELVAKHVGDEVLEIEVEPSEREQVIRALERKQLRYEDAGYKVHVFSPDSRDEMKALVRSPDKVTVRRANLEDVFLMLTGRSLVE